VSLVLSQIPDFSSHQTGLRLKPVNLKIFLPYFVGKIHGNGRSDLEDLAFPNLPPREADEIGRRVCLRKLRPVDSENTQLLPQRVKSCSVSGSTLLTSSVRNHARSAFKRFSPSTALRLSGERDREGLALKI